ncbi:MAG TPA: cupin domain-containing protein [Bacteroidales bacterium]|nr:cupin domain-containing protein [Bacteroidales bacterium]HQQ01650.1 cupin domain-containing protein [Bacteroidales bacterium]
MGNKLFATAEIMQFTQKVEYSKEGIVSKVVIDKPSGTITLFAFDSGQRLSEHSAPYDALVQVLEGEAEIIIDRKPFLLKEGDSIIMPAGIPHAVNAPDRFKMLLTMIRG